MILTHNQLAFENSLRRILPAGVVSCWIPDGYGRAKDVIRGNHGTCFGTHPNVPVISMSRPPNRVTDGGLNIWTTATNLTNWIEAIAGTSTINREATEKIEGDYSCRFDIDASNNVAYIRGLFSLTPSNKHKLVIWYKNSAVGKTAHFTFASVGGAVYLQDDGTWGAYNDVGLPNSTIWKKYEQTFNGHADHSNYYLYLARASAASSSIYFDNVSIEELKPSLINPSVGWVFGGDDYISVPTDKSLDITDEVSVVAWMMSQGDQGDFAGIVDKDSAYGLRVGGSDKPYIQTNCSGGVYHRYFTDALPVGIFVCLMGTYKSSDSKLRAYKNGIFEGETTHPYGGDINTVADPLLLGVARTYFINGYTALSFVANKALSEAQFNNFYLNSKGIFAPRS